MAPPPHPAAPGVVDPFDGAVRLPLGWCWLAFLSVWFVDRFEAAPTAVAELFEAVLLCIILVEFRPKLETDW